jgi:hypothetical protein
VAGFYFKIKASATATSATNILTECYALTSSNSTAQGLQYPLDINTVTFTGLPTGTDMVVLEAGTTNILYQVDSYGSSSIPYVYSGADTVDVGFIKPGYVPFYVRNLALGTSDSSIPVSLTLDRNYQA